MLDLDQLLPGDRVVLRYRLETDSQQPETATFSDALGEIEQVNRSSVSVRTRKGLIAVPRNTITHAKRVPPAPVRRIR